MAAWIRSVMAVLLALPAAIAGCAASPDTNSGPGQTCSTNIPGVTATSVKIGYIYPDTGPAALTTVFRGARAGASARIDQQNDQGGVNGRRIDLVWGDDQSNPDAFLLTAHRLVDSEKVFGLVLNSVVVDKAVGWLAQEDVPVTGTASSVVWSEYPNLFHFGNRYNPGDTSVIGDFVKARGGTKAILVTDRDLSATQNLAAKFAPSLQSRGVTVVDTLSYTQGITNPASLVARIKNSGADTLIGAAQTESFIDVYAAAKAAGVRLRVALASSGISPDLLAQRGGDMAGMTVLSTIAAPDSPARAAYVEAMSTYAPEAVDPTEELAIGGYVAADQMINGLRLAGACPTRQGFIDALRSVTKYSAGGLIAPIDVSRPRQPTLCENFLTVDPTGKNLVVLPPPAARRPPHSPATATGAAPP
ncbi:ABC transporter substrate-binding protein [Pseudofrankia saprophytica]|uniref:ABC transporter substrate-binding protein n=1 Tax=Pseudofrankia saprophytica TaxID=298655 RepID=UPI000234C4FD|nr:ABC transporter substrate-binding protein [Pseudofrankia saprophytica]